MRSPAAAGAIRVGNRPLLCFVVATPVFHDFLKVHSQERADRCVFLSRKNSNFPDKIPVQFQGMLAFCFVGVSLVFMERPHGTICSTYLRAAPFYALRKKYCNVQFRGKMVSSDENESREGPVRVISHRIGLARLGVRRRRIGRCSIHVRSRPGLRLSRAPRGNPLHRVVRRPSGHLATLLPGK